MKLTCVGRSFFTPEMPSAISGGAEVWLGYYQSLRATQAGLTLNVDMSAMAFVRSMPMVRREDGEGGGGEDGKTLEETTMKFVRSAQQ